MRLALLGLCALTLSAADKPLAVYALDADGGKSTLYVSPSGQTMLVDTGYDGFDGRDAKRIMAAVKDAGVTQIDYLVITHYHKDHMGGVRQLAAQIPIKNFVDHGETFEKVKDVKALYDTYNAIRDKGNHILVKAGDIIPVTGFQVQVVTAAGVGIAAPLAAGGQTNPACASYKPMEETPGDENAHSIGMIMTYGKFRLSDLGDLFWNEEHDLACPVNKLGTVDVYMTTHHGTKTSDSPQSVWSLQPRVAIMNNGADKGGAPSSWKTIEASPGLEDLWQIHFSIEGGKNHNVSEQFIANVEEQCTGQYIKLTAQNDGSFSVFNSRNGFTKTYPKRP